MPRSTRKRDGMHAAQVRTGAESARSRAVSEPDRILRPVELARVLGVSRSTVYDLELRPDFPRRVRLSDRVSGWLWSEVRAWLKRNQDAGRGAARGVRR